jgi:hypothetical protein
MTERFLTNFIRKLLWISIHTLGCFSFSKSSKYGRCLKGYYNNIVRWWLKTRIDEEEKTSIASVQQPKQPVVSREWLFKHVSAATESRDRINSPSTIEAVFSVGSVQWQTRPLVRGGARHRKKNSNSQIVLNIWSWAPDGARHQDWLTDWPSVVIHSLTHVRRGARHRQNSKCQTVINIWS